MILFMQVLRNQELNNGRLAMIAAAGIAFQEAVSKTFTPLVDMHFLQSHMSWPPSA